VFLAQYSTDSGAAAGIFFIWLLLLVGLAFIPAAIAGNKGYSLGAFYAFGLFFFVPALIVALVMQAKEGSRDRPLPPRSAVPPSPPTPPTASPVPPALGPDPAPMVQSTARGRPAPGPGAGVVRECPHCKEPMRRDASVCPHCRRESPAWEYRDGVWWTTDSSGNRVWYDESHGLWRSADYVPPVRLPTYRVLLMSVGDAPATARMIFEQGNEHYTAGGIRGLRPGSSVSSGLPEQRAAALKESLATVGTVVELVPEAETSSAG
jgi:hypothetical protein